jgi:hypothetical protein
MPELPSQGRSSQRSGIPPAQPHEPEPREVLIMSDQPTVIDRLQTLEHRHLTRRNKKSL